MRKPTICRCKNKGTQISCEVTVKLISAFVFATKIVQSLFFLNLKFQALAIFCGCTALFELDLVGIPKDMFSHDFAQIGCQVNT